MAKKQITQQIHALKRLSERFVTDSKAEDLRAIAKLIRSKKSIHIKKQSLTRQIHIVEFKGQSIPVVYDKLRNQVATVLPVESIAHGKLLNKSEYSNLSKEQIKNIEEQEIVKMFCLLFKRLLKVKKKKNSDSSNSKKQNKVLHCPQCNGPMFKTYTEHNNKFTDCLQCSGCKWVKIE